MSASSPARILVDGGECSLCNYLAVLPPTRHEGSAWQRYANDASDVRAGFHAAENDGCLLGLLIRPKKLKHPRPLPE